MRQVDGRVHKAATQITGCGVIESKTDELLIYSNVLKLDDKPKRMHNNEQITKPQVDLFTYHFV